MYRKGIFISYSHKDKKWLDTIMTFLKPYSRDEKISILSDKDILPGSRWDIEIKKQLETCRVAILLVTPDFLASDFIIEKELSLILKRAGEGELIVYWIAVSHSAYKQTDLSKIQSANNPAKPLDELSKSERDRTLVQISEKIANGMDLNAISNVLKIIDDFVPQQKAFIDNVQVDNRPNDYSIQASQENEKIELKRRDNSIAETITADDLDNLDRNSKILIRSHENTMKDLFERWAELQPKSYSRDSIIKQDARDEMALIRQDLCVQLNAILTYLQSMHKNLDDHYHHVRFICLQ